ncbi:hypothetical protein MtrunA17_Chr1g0178881 [Medicago truncatula]|uniref:Uncharacterized protein n=1 Tax=Medicago truncatula TaxID=3880 RepID=A0A396JY45_MEDTR|nr:hypothetical protein MtrunA17_Chr1g0178881 [Medicago truncatula]
MNMWILFNNIRITTLFTYCLKCLSLANNKLKTNINATNKAQFHEIFSAIAVDEHPQAISELYKSLAQYDNVICFCFLLVRCDMFGFRGMNYSIYR